MKKRIVQVLGYVAALAVGLTVGAVTASSDPVTSPEYVALATERDELATTQESMEDENRGLYAEVKSLSAEVGEIEDREAKVQELADELDDLAADLQKQTRSVAAREKAVGLIEATIARNTIGDGTYQAGKHIKAGTYRTKSSPRDCYWAVSGDANGSNLLNNHYGNGPTSVYVAPGQWLQLDGCGEMTLQQ